MDPLEDGGPTTGAAATGVELVQMDLWQDLVAEVPTLADTVHRKLHGLQLSYGVVPKQVYGILVRNRIRLVDLVEVSKGPSISVVHHAFTLNCHRVI